MILGVDPGAHGALALLDERGDLVEVEDMPMEEADGRRQVNGVMLAAVLRRWGARLAVIERVNAAPIAMRRATYAGQAERRQSPQTMFAFGNSAGTVYGVCCGLAVPCTFVWPTAWKRAMAVTADKESSRTIARHLWPARAGWFARVRDDGRAEAALIAHHGLSQWRMQSLG